MSFKSSDGEVSSFTIYSPNSNWKLVFSNGILTIQDSLSTIYWRSSKTTTTKKIRLQRDGNLIIGDGWRLEKFGALDGNHSLTISDCGIAKITLESGSIFETLPSKKYTGDYSQWNYRPTDILYTILKIYTDAGYSDKVKAYSGIALNTNKLQSGEILLNNSSISYYNMKLTVTNNSIKVTNGTTEIYNKAITTEPTKISCLLSMNLNGNILAYAAYTEPPQYNDDPINYYTIFNKTISYPEPGMYIVLGDKGYGIIAQNAKETSWEVILNYKYTINMSDKCIPWTNTDECTKYLIDNRSTTEYNTTNYKTLLTEKQKYLQPKINNILTLTDLNNLSNEKTFLSNFSLSDIPNNLTNACEEFDSGLSTTICKEIYSTNSTNDKIKNSIKKIEIMNCKKDNNFINSSCSTVVANNPELYINNMKTYCNIPSNYISKTCTDYYQNIKDTILSSLNTKLSSFNNYENINYENINYDYLLLFFIIVFFIIFMIKKNKKEIIYINDL